MQRIFKSEYISTSRCRHYFSSVLSTRKSYFYYYANQDFYVITSFPEPPGLSSAPGDSSGSGVASVLATSSGKQGHNNSLVLSDSPCGIHHHNNIIKIQQVQLLTPITRKWLQHIGHRQASVFPSSPMHSFHWRFLTRNYLSRVLKKIVSHSVNTAMYIHVASHLHSPTQAPSSAGPGTTCLKTAASASSIKF